jgi:hypothetical protein
MSRLHLLALSAPAEVTPRHLPPSGRYTEGRPLPLHDRAKEFFNRAVLNDTLFLSIINVVDYSILVRTRRSMS